MAEWRDKFPSRPSNMSSVPGKNKPALERLL